MAHVRPAVYRTRAESLLRERSRPVQFAVFRKPEANYFAEARRRLRLNLTDLSLSQAHRLADLPGGEAIQIKTGQHGKVSFRTISGLTDEEATKLADALNSELLPYRALPLRRFRVRSRNLRSPPSLNWQ